MKTEAVVVQEKKKQICLLNILTHHLVLSERIRCPKNFVAGLAGIFQTLNVLLSVLFHVTFVTRFEVTFDTSKAAIDAPFNQ